MKEQKTQVFAGSGSIGLAQEIVDYLDMELSRITIGEFPDGETNIKVESDVRGSNVFVVLSTCPPVDDNLMERRKEAVKAERIVEESVIRFRSWYDSLDVVPAVVALREKISAIARSEAEKTLCTLKDLNNDDREAVFRMTEAIVSKIMHDPTVFLKNSAEKKNRHQYLDTVKRLFNLDE